MRPGELLSRNLFPIEFSQNSPSDMGKREYFCTADGRFRDAEMIYSPSILVLLMDTAEEERARAAMLKSETPG